MRARGNGETVRPQGSISGIRSVGTTTRKANGVTRQRPEVMSATSQWCAVTDPPHPRSDGTVRVHQYWDSTLNPSAGAALSRIVPRRHFFENFGRAWSFSAWIERWVGRKTTYGGGAVEILRGQNDVFQPCPPPRLIAPPRGLPSVRDFSIDWERLSPLSATRYHNFHGFILFIDERSDCHPQHRPAHAT